MGVHPPEGPIHARVGKKGTGKGGKVVKLLQKNTIARKDEVGGTGELGIGRTGAKG